MALTKKDLLDALRGQKEDIKRDIKKDIDTAVAQVIDFVMKNCATKDGLGKVENRLERIEVDMKDVKRSINDLKANTLTPQEFAKHEKRIGKLEAAVFPS